MLRPSCNFKNAGKSLRFILISEENVVAKVLERSSVVRCLRV